MTSLQETLLLSWFVLKTSNNLSYVILSSVFEEVAAPFVIARSPKISHIRRQSNETNFIFIDNVTKFSYKQYNWLSFRVWIKKIIKLLC